MLSTKFGPGLLEFLQERSLRDPSILFWFLFGLQRPSTLRELDLSVLQHILHFSSNYVVCSHGLVIQENSTYLKFKPVPPRHGRPELWNECFLEMDVLGPFLGACYFLLLFLTKLDDSLKRRSYWARF